MSDRNARRSRASRPPPQARDVDATPFTPILEALLSRAPGADGVALVDGEGETVDYAGLASPFDMRIAAAHLQIVLRHVEELGKLGSPRSIVVRGSRKSVVIRSLPDGYALAVLLRRGAGFTATARAYAVCERALAVEAGWPTPEGRFWCAVDVETEPGGRPRSIGGTEVEVLGTLVDVPRGQRGFRVRGWGGLEAMLVREPGGHWYLDEDLPIATRA